mmetsp:Transcript_10911/g.18010  ORF Transcript_10911/g.18010 Transcript_10911/m.18010 type:complete len:156 (+) Transcript_10911:54-521(+)
MKQLLIEALELPQATHLDVIQNNEVKSGLEGTSVVTIRCDRSVRSVIKNKAWTIDHPKFPGIITVKDDFSGKLCSFCCSYGHTWFDCNTRKSGGQPTCSECSAIGHQGKTCHAKAKHCANCGGDHNIWNQRFCKYQHTAIGERKRQLFGHDGAEL